jgi:hypothetical protein
MSQIGYGSGDAVATPMDLYVPLTGFNITPQTDTLVINPAGTLATGTVNFPTGASDGQTLTIMSTQTQTALTLVAATGDTIAGTAVTALTANTPVKWKYSLNGAIGTAGTNKKTWFRMA